MDDRDTGQSADGWRQFDVSNEPDPQSVQSLLEMSKTALTLLHKTGFTDEGLRLTSAT
jgi:hypothetical protein